MHLQYGSLRTDFIEKHNVKLDRKLLLDRPTILSGIPQKKKYKEHKKREASN